MGEEDDLRKGAVDLPAVDLPVEWRQRALRYGTRSRCHVFEQRTTAVGSKGRSSTSSPFEH